MGGLLAHKVFCNPRLFSTLDQGRHIIMRPESHVAEMPKSVDLTTRNIACKAFEHLVLQVELGSYSLLV